MSKSLIAMPREAAISALSNFCAKWVGQGLSNYCKAIKVRKQSELLSRAPKTTGHLWWKRETTKLERKQWMEREWEHSEDFFGVPLERFGYDWHVRDADERAMRIRRVLESIQSAPPKCTVYIDTKLWGDAHRLVR